MHGFDWMVNFCSIDFIGWLGGLVGLLVCRFVDADSRGDMVGASILLGA